MNNSYTKEEVDRISNSVSVLDYFLYLEQKGKVKFETKKGRDFFFKANESKYSVNDNGFFSFQNNEGGKILKAIMTFENKSWKEAIDFLKNFNGNNISLIAERKRDFITRENNNYSEIKIQYTGQPNNEKLLAYFNDRGISTAALQENTKQIHYSNNGRKFFGIGLENYSGGFEVRNPLAKIKIGKTDLSEIKGSKNEIVLFEGMTDLLSFLQLQKLNNNKNNRTLISLNSITNTDRFLDLYKNFEGKIFLCLDGDNAGNLATQKILKEFSVKNIKDIRPFYNISEKGNNDLNDYLKSKIKNEKININQNEVKNDHKIESERISDVKSVEGRTSKQDNRELDKKSESQQEDHYTGRQNVDSKNVGDGSIRTENEDRRTAESRGGSIDHSQQKDVGIKNPLGRILNNSTNIPELDELILKYKGKKLSNDEVSEVVSAACFISDDLKIILKDNIQITDDLKNIANQFKSGGVAKEGRGILDEYYTDLPIVDAIKNLIKNNFNSDKPLQVLEPSVGTGNFLNLLKDLNVQSFATAFEINETTAKISKIFHPQTEINVRSFETEFIDENGFKKEQNQTYDLILGNPPYGEHRGLYKGLGEEPKIAKYEDYFVKRSLDVLIENGTLAMVLPSGWLNRQKKMEGAEIATAFRLPSGAFAGTQIGTDIIILRKSIQSKELNISDYFIKNPQNVLGEIREKTNRFGRLEKYVHGSLDDALATIEQLNKKRHDGIQTNMFEQAHIVSNNQLQPIKPNDEAEDIKPILTTENNDDVQEVIASAIEALESIKFKSPATKSELTKFETYQTQLSENQLSVQQIEKIKIRAERIVNNSSKNNAEYTVQKTPNISKKILKYQFEKEDEIVNFNEQNNSNLSDKELKAFIDTNYDGTINNHELHAEHANYMNGVWYHDFYYAEGNVYKKLQQLENDFEDKNSAQYIKQKQLLESVLPTPKKLGEIIISPNHEFIHKFDLGTTQKSRYNFSTKEMETVVVDYSLADKFKDFVDTLPYEAFQGSSSWEVRSFVDNETVTGSDKERNALIRERRKEAANDLFSKFINEELDDDLKHRFTKEFNQNYNNIHVPDYSKFPLFSKIHLNFKGRALKLTEVQKAGIGRNTTKGVGLLAHEVGFGKTLSGILSMHEAMERNNAKRPLIVVPNESILKQWVDTIFETIPNAKVNVLGNLGKDYDLSKFDNKDNEITIVTYEGFNNIGFSKEITERLANKFNYISASEMKSVTNTTRDEQIEMQKEKEIEGKMKRGKIYDWEDFKFDHLTFDEVHNANHIVGKVRIEDRRFASDFRSQNQQTSKLGINTWMAAQYIQEQQNGRNVTLLSATPFTNKPLEYYSILSLIANNRLEEKGYFNVNNFFETFMEADNDMEIDAKGDVKFKANVRRFKNNTLFQQLLSEFIDIKGEDDNPELVRPTKINKEYKIDQNDLTKEQYDLLNQNFSESEKGAILTHILNARLIAISPYLSPFYDGEQPTLKEFIENSPKLHETMKLIEQNLKDIPDGGQIIYSELAVSEFPKLKEYLMVEIGLKDSEVGIITGKTTKPNRLKIQDEFNNGKIKVIIGSEAIQEGMNLQMKTTDTYLLSLPYNFTSLRQVEGRSWRQGNQHENVRMNFMLTNDSIDVFMLQKLQAKQARYLEAMKKGADVLDISDIDTQELKTSIITDPYTRADIEIELLKKKIVSEKNKFSSDSAFVLRKFEEYNNALFEVKKAEADYNRILGYSENNDKEYWTNQLPSYQNKIDAAQKNVDEVVQNLAKKGVNVAEIKSQTEITENKIKELEDKLENLPNVRAELIETYRMEKQLLQESKSKINIVLERKTENTELFPVEKLEPMNLAKEEIEQIYEGIKR